MEPLPRFRVGFLFDLHSHCPTSLSTHKGNVKVPMNTKFLFLIVRDCYTCRFCKQNVVFTKAGLQCIGLTHRCKRRLHMHTSYFSTWYPWSYQRWCVSFEICSCDSEWSRGTFLFSSAGDCNTSYDENKLSIDIVLMYIRSYLYRW